MYDSQVAHSTCMIAMNTINTMLFHYARKERSVMIVAIQEQRHQKLKVISQCDLMSARQRGFLPSSNILHEVQGWCTKKCQVNNLPFSFL